jgi:hypothetical protein
LRPVLRPFIRIASSQLWLVLLLWSILFSAPLHAQNISTDTSQKPDHFSAPLNSFLSTPVRVQPSNNYDTVFWLYKGLCKATGAGKRLVPPSTGLVADAAPAGPPSSKRASSIRVNGNIQYSFLYRSFVDTPFSQQDYQQHTVQTNLNIVIKNRYPINLNFSRRISNSPYFRDFLDVNMQFDPRTYQRNVKQELLERLKTQQLDLPDLKAAEAAAKVALDKYNALKSSLDDPGMLQRITEEREREYYKMQETAGQLPDSVIRANVLSRVQQYKTKFEDKIHKKTGEGADNKYANYVKQKKTELDSLEQKLRLLQSRSDSMKNNIEKKLASVRQKLYKATRPKELRQVESEEGLAGEKRKGMDKFLDDVKGFGIGRSVINYSELTAWNVSLTGLHVEYNPGIYTALAAGKIDYGFRDFLGRNTRRRGQDFLMGRIGMGDPDHQAIIVSAFGGKKYNYGSPFIDTVSDFVSIAGYSIEAIWKKDQNTSITAEIAKTTRPVSGMLRDNSGIKTLFEFGDNANLGVSVKAQSKISKTNTDVSGFFRKTGKNFQSFSLFTYNTDQTAWLLRVDQPFFSEKLNITAMLRRNDFVNPFSEKTFKTSTIFKSFQLTARIPRWPVISAGYLPGTQLYIVDKERIRENAYYILNGSIVHSYSLDDLRMVSSLIYNRFAGKGTDSGFIAYSGVNYMASQAFIFRRLQLDAGYIFTDQEQMQYYTVEANGDYSITPKLRVGAGVKQNKISGGQSYLGSRAQVMIEIGKLGGFQLQYEKSYLPTIWQSLYPVETGRVSWFKYF